MQEATLWGCHIPERTFSHRELHRADRRRGRLRPPPVWAVQRVCRGCAGWSHLPGRCEEIGRGYTLVWEKVCSALHPEESEAIDDFKEFLNDLSVDDLLLFVYVTYPEYAHESRRLRKIQQRRAPLSASLYREVSLEKAVFLAGMNIESYLDHLRGGA